MVHRPGPRKRVLLVPPQTDLYAWSVAAEERLGVPVFERLRGYRWRLPYGDQAVPYFRLPRLLRVWSDR